jgi:ABC-type glycerol-3-phosphate transport system substrate-binding protein
MKKQLIAVLLTISMVTALFSGCSSKKETDNSKTGNQSTTETADSEDYPVIKMAYALVFPAPDEKPIEDALNKILKEKAHAQIDLVGVEFGNWATQLNLMLTGGGDNSADLFNSFWYTSVSNLVSKGQVMKLDDLLAKEGSDIKGLFTNGLEDYLKCGVVNGTQYGIPCMYSYCTENLYYAKKADCAKANIDWSQVKDVDGMSDAILKLKKANPDKCFIPGSTEPYWVPKSIDYLGDTKYLGVLTDPTKSTKVENFYESDYFLNFLKHVEKWKKAGVFSPDPLSNSNTSLTNLLTGVTDGTPGYAWDAGVNMGATGAQNNLELDGTKVTDALSTTSDVTTYMWHISSFCKNPEAAMRILNVLYTDPEASNLITNGVEGLTYDLNDKGQMVYPKGKKSMSDLGWAAASMAYWPNVMLCKTWSYEPTDIYTQMLEKNKTCNKSLALGFSFNSSKVADQITTCNNVVAQYYTPLMYGEIDIDSTLKEFQSALKDAGIDDIITEKQAQLDAWLKSK